MKKLLVLFVVTVFVASIAIFLCKKDDVSPVTDVKTGKISGYVYSKKGTTLGAVRVFIQDNPS